MADRPHLSICIPVFKRKEILSETLRSIYDEIKNIPSNIIEVIVTDNDPEKEAFESFKLYKNLSNWHYHSVDVKGFLNSIQALKHGNGNFLKLHNSQFVWNKGSVQRVLRVTNSMSNSVIFWGNGQLLSKSFEKISNFDLFIRRIGYFVTWSNGFMIRKDDLDINIDDLNPIFPHTSLLLTQARAKEYCIDNTNLWRMQRVSKKGGFHFIKEFENFVGDVEREFEKGIVSVETLESLKRELRHYLYPKMFLRTKLLGLENYDFSHYWIYFRSLYGFFWPISIIIFSIVSLFRVIKVKLHYNENIYLKIRRFFRAKIPLLKSCK